MITLLLPHQEQIAKSSRQWGEYARRHGLPNHKTILKYLGSSWAEVRETLQVEPVQFRHTRESLIDLLNQHKEQLARPMSEWEQYAYTYDLPSITTIYRLVGSWGQVREELGVEKTASPEHEKYSRQIILSLLVDHKEQVAKPLREWEKYAQKQGLPSKSTIVKKVGNWKKVRMLLGIPI